MLAKVGPCVVLAILALSLLASSPTCAHSPLFPVENHDIASAQRIDEPAKSFAIYHELEAGEASYYSFYMNEGSRIYLQLLTPAPPSDGFVPGLALLVPGGDNPRPSSLPSYVEIPQGYGNVVVLGDANAMGELEPFTPGPIFSLAEIDSLAPRNGTYYAVVFGSGAGGSYALAVGYVEGFTAEEILLLPLSLLTVYQWEGQELWVALLPYLAVAAGGIFYALLRRRWTGRPGRPVHWLALLCSLAFLGSSTSVVAQLAFALTRVPLSTSVAVSLLFAVAYLVMGVVALRFAFGGDARLRPTNRALFLIVGAVGLALWGGLYLGPALAFVIAVAPDPRS